MIVETFDFAAIFKAAPPQSLTVHDVMMDDHGFWKVEQHWLSEDSYYRTQPVYIRWFPRTHWAEPHIMLETEFKHFEFPTICLSRLKNLCRNRERRRHRGPWSFAALRGESCITVRALTCISITDEAIADLCRHPMNQQTCEDFSESYVIRIKCLRAAESDVASMHAMLMLPN